MPLHSSTSFSSMVVVFATLPLGVLNLALTDSKVNTGLVTDSTWGAFALEVRDDGTVRLCHFQH